MDKQLYPYTQQDVYDNHTLSITRLGYYKRLGLDHEALRREILDCIDITPRTILEIGTGKGDLCVELAKRYEAVTTVDIDQPAQFQALLNAVHHKVDKRITFILNDASSLTFEPASFDLVIAAYSFHHFENPFVIMKKMADLAAKAVLIAEFNNVGFGIIDEAHRREGRCHEAKNIEQFDMTGIHLEEHGFSVTQLDFPLQTIYYAKRTQQ